MDFIVNVREVLAVKTYDYICYGEDDVDVEPIITNTPTPMPVMQLPLKEAVAFLQSETAATKRHENDTCTRLEIVLNDVHSVARETSVLFMFDNVYERIVDLIKRWEIALPTA